MDTGHRGKRGARGEGHEGGVGGVSQGSRGPHALILYMCWASSHADGQLPHPSTDSGAAFL